jgi:TonB family protein
MRPTILLFCGVLMFGQSTFHTPERKSEGSESICLSEILVAPKSGEAGDLAVAKAKANDLLKEIHNGAVFEEIAKKYSDGPSALDGGAVGVFKRGQLAQEIEDKVFAMKAGDVSDVIRTKQGFVILRVTGPCPMTDEHKGLVDVLSDTQGVDFRPYLGKVLPIVKDNWYHLIPASAQTKRGKLAIEFAIARDGKITDMRLVATSGDTTLDRAAWGSIAGSNPFPALPSEFTGPFLALRFRFVYNPTEGNVDKSSGILVILSALGGLTVPVGGSTAVTATVTGTKENAVQWRVTGDGCFGSACGTMAQGLYQAPSVQPSPPFVTLTAISEADPTAKASVTVYIVRPSRSR